MKIKFGRVFLWCIRLVLIPFRCTMEAIECGNTGKVDEWILYDASSFNHFLAVVMVVLSTIYCWAFLMMCITVSLVMVKCQRQREGSGIYCRQRASWSQHVKLSNSSLGWHSPRTDKNSGYLPGIKKRWIFACFRLLSMDFVLWLSVVSFGFSSFQSKNLPNTANWISVFE